MPAPFTETHVVGAGTCERKVHAADCAALAMHHIAHAGVADAAVSPRP